MQGMQRTERLRYLAHPYNHHHPSNEDTPLHCCHLPCHCLVEWDLAILS